MSNWALLLALIALFAGMALGRRFKVLILLPAIACGFPLAFIVGFARTDALWPGTMMAALAVASLQIGYLAGVAIRFGLHAERLNGFVSALRGNSHSTGRSVT